MELYETIGEQAPRKPDGRKRLAMLIALTIIAFLELIS